MEEYSLKLKKIEHELKKARERLIFVYEEEGDMSSPLVLEASRGFDRVHNEWRKYQQESGNEILAW